MKVLLIEDDSIIADAISRKISASGIEVETVQTLGDARIAISAGRGLGVIILDLNLPDGDGLVFLREQRRASLELPVLILTARDEPIQRVLGLDTGADDYLVKPFDMEELVARVRALQRRSLGRTAPVIQYKRLTLDPAQMKVFLDDSEIDVPVSQFRLLQYLLETQGRVTTKQQIIDALYQWEQSVENNTIEVYVSQLRKLLWPELIKTMRGVGYMVPKTSSIQ